MCSGLGVGVSKRPGVPCYTSRRGEGRVVPSHDDLANDFSDEMHT